MSLRVDIRKQYKKFTLEVSFHNEEGTLGILGASGSGKSLTLKCIAGLASPDEGVIVSGSRTLFDSAAKIDLSPQERNVGYLFQSYALFPRMTVRENIAIAVRDDPGARGGDKAKDAVINALLARYGLSEFGDRYPAKLSGGQQQRVALARIFAYGPEILLLDEPFSALDTFLRENMQIELLRIISKYDGDVILVTHSRDEAYKICDNLLIMQDGGIEAAGGTKAVFADPGAVTAARITGCKNISRIERLSEHKLTALDWGVELETGRIIKDEHRYIGVRAHDFSPAPAERSGTLNEIEVIVDEVVEGPFDKTVLFRAARGAEDAGDAEGAGGSEDPDGAGAPGDDGRPDRSAGSRESVRWICDRNEDVSDVKRLFLDGDDILLLTAAGPRDGRRRNADESRTATDCNATTD
jgi:molybdate transport system ATP-binding protein